MTPEILEYLLRASIIWLVLLAYYFIVGRQASFRFQRFFLLGGWLFGLLVPLLPSIAGEAGLPVAGLPTISFSGPVATTVPTMEVIAVSSWELVDLLPWLYLLGALFFGARTLVKGWVTEQYLLTGQRSTFSGHPVVRHAGIESPFAARGYVFLPASITDADLEHTALIHECSHLRARHHYDKFLLTLGSILLWFHPLMWAYRRLLATVHEYEADAAVLQQVPARTYGLQLLHCSLGPTGGLGLFSSPLKQRIEMITNNTLERKLRLIPFLTLFFLTTGLVFTCSDIDAQDLTPVRDYTNSDNAMVIKPVYNDDAKIFIIGTEAGIAISKQQIEGLLEAVHGKITYPKSAIKAGETGKFRIRIVVDQAGLIRRIEHFSATELPPVTEITVVAKGVADESVVNTSEVLKDEITQTMIGLKVAEPFLLSGSPGQCIMALDVVFKLEE